MTLVNIGIFAILCTVLVSADPRRITNHYEFHGALIFSSVTNNSVLHVVCNQSAVYFDEKYNERREPCNATLDSYDGARKKLFCPFTKYPFYNVATRVFQVDEENILIATFRDGKILLENIHLADCKLTPTTLPAPPKSNFGIYYIQPIVYESTYNVIIYGCLEKYTKPCRNIFDRNGTLIEKLQPLTNSKTDEYQVHCTVEGKYGNPANGLIYSCGTTYNRTDILITEAGEKVLKVWPPNRKPYIRYEDNILLCFPPEKKVLNCSVFNNDGTLQNEFTLHNGYEWKNLKFKLLPNGFILYYMVETTDPNTEPQEDRKVVTYVRRYDFTGKLVKEYIVDYLIKRNVADNIFVNGAGELCVAMFGSHYALYSHYFDFYAQCYEDLLL